MPGVPRKPHDPVALSLSVAAALVVARQLNQDVVVQRYCTLDISYPISLTGELPRNRQKRNCYTITPAGKIVPFPGNPPYVEPTSEYERQRREREEHETEETRLRHREEAFRQAEKNIGVLASEVTGPMELLEKDGASDESAIRGSAVMQGAAEAYYPVYVSMNRQDGSVKVLMVGSRSSRGQALKTAKAWARK